MPEKSRYKKVPGIWARKQKKETGYRTRINDDALNNATEKEMPYKKKKSKKKNTRSDHKHLYNDLVLIKIINSRYMHVSYEIEPRCSICGVRESKTWTNYEKYPLYTKYKGPNGDIGIRSLTEEEIQEKYGPLRIEKREL